MKAAMITTLGGFAVCDLPDLEAMQSVVGGLIEPVRLEMPGGTRFDAWVNEEGLLVDLPANLFAALALLEVTGGASASWMPHGDVFVTGGVDDHGNTRDIPAAVLDALRLETKQARIIVGGRSE